MPSWPSRWRLLEAAEDAPALFEPSDAALDDVAESVGLAIEGFVGGGFGSSARNHRLDLVAIQPLADPFHVVALVAGELVRSVARPVARARQSRGLEDRKEVLAFVTLPGADRDGDGNSLAVANQVDLGREAASGAS